MTPFWADPTCRAFLARKSPGIIDMPMSQPFDLSGPAPGVFCYGWVLLLSRYDSVFPVLWLVGQATDICHAGLVVQHAARATVQADLLENTRFAVVNGEDISVFGQRLSA